MPDSSTKVLGVGGNLDHRVSARPHQQIVGLAFVLVRNICDLFGQSEDEVEVSYGQQFSFPCRQPCLCRTRLTLWAVAVAARVVGDVLMRAVDAARNMPAERRCAAALDCAHDLQLIRLIWPALAARQAAPWARKISATSNDGPAWRPMKVWPCPSCA